MKINLTKIVGVADETTWSQVHDFTSEGEKKFSHGRLIAALEFVALEKVDTSSFGTEIITRLQETYYSNESEEISKKVAQTMESLAAEFLTKVSLKIVMIVIVERDHKNYLYAGRSSANSFAVGVDKGKDKKIGGQVYLRRGKETVGLLDEEIEIAQVVSGELQAGDGVMLGTGRFFELVDTKLINSSLDDYESTEVAETLAGVIQGSDSSSQAAGLVVKLVGEKSDLPKASHLGLTSEEETEETVEPEKTEGELSKKGLAIWEKVKRVLGDKLGKKEVYLGRREAGKQKSAATVAGLLILVFVISLVLSGRKKEKARIEAEYQAVIEEVSYKYDEAENLIELNPLRAKSLLTDSKGKINLYLEEHEGENQELKDWIDKIDVSLASVQREYQVESAIEWFDFSLTKEGFKGSDWESEENKLLVWDESGNTAIELDLESKASGVVVGGSDVAGSELVGLAGERGMLVDKNEVKIFEASKDGDGKVLAQVTGDEWGVIKDAVGFSSNLYLLDGSEQGQIWKYLGVNDGLSAKRSYLSGDSYDMSEAVSMAIDGSVWVLFSDGTIVKYVRGVKDSFVVAGLDQPFKEPIKMFASPETENLYILDRQATRVVVISKTGEYRAQYVWPGIAGALDLVVSEDLGKIFLLTGEKVFVIELK